MSSAATYAAVHLGDDSVSVLVESASGRSLRCFETALSMKAGSLVFLGRELDPNDSNSDSESHRDEAEVERFPWSFIDDEEVLVGSIPVPAEHVFCGTVADSLGRSGVHGPVDMLEIVCPSFWGDRRQSVMRRAVSALAREVAVVDAATAAVRSAGERAPSCAVVVELNEMSSTVSALTSRAAANASSGSGEPYERSGRWVALGSRDLAGADSYADTVASIDERVTTCAAAFLGNGPIEVFVVESTGHTTVPDLLRDRSHRLHRLRGPDLVRSMGGGVEEVGRDDLSAVHDAAVPDGTPRPARAAAWLAEVPPTPDPSADRRVPILLAGVVAAVAVVAAGGFVVFDSVTNSSTPVAMPARSTDAASAITSDPPAPSSDWPSHLETTNVDEPYPSVPIESETDVGPPPMARSSFGRASVEIPASWSERSEVGRLLLVPPDYPDRRIVLATVDLQPAVTFDDVADDLEEQLVARGERSTIGNFTRATDFGARIGISYVESPGDSSVVQWRVFVDDGLQISIGCQSSMGSEHVLDDDCAHAVESLSVAGS
ncbi:type VII secretion-associated protein [Rhodococcus sovatensis]|uniref:Type VII secretion-associated protein n=1 Tax=Rhodococcus sovatensis TaxID=1805840 RepID=A0ABZ2PQJ5_9NOCA